MTRNISIVIPCLNEDRTIKKAVLDAWKNAKLYLKKDFEIIVADNGSTDGTLEILKKLKAVIPVLKVINVPVKGYGAALHWGILTAKGKYVIFADADMSYPFSNIEKFVDKINRDYDLLLGTRLKGDIQEGAMPFLHRYFGTPILTLLIRSFYGIKTTDCNSGMRMVKKSFYQTLNMRNSGMEWASELLLKTALHKGSYGEVPIKFIKDKRGKKAHLSRWSDGWRHLKAILLLKPLTIALLIPVFIVVAAIYYQNNFSITFLFLDLAVVLTLSLFTLNLLKSTIEGNDNGISQFLKTFKLVPIVALIAFIVGMSVFFIPDERLGTKLFLVNLLGIVFMWIFLIETIKTHLVNRLPDL